MGVAGVAAIFMVFTVVSFDYLAAPYERGKNSYYYRSSYLLMGFGVFFLCLAGGNLFVNSQIIFEKDYSAHYYFITSAAGFFYLVIGSSRYLRGHSALVK